MGASDKYALFLRGVLLVEEREKALDD